MTGVHLGEDGRRLLAAAGMATALTLVATLLAGLLIGIVAGTGSLGAFRGAAVLLTAAAPAVGALVGARQATQVLGHGVQAAAVGLTGAMVVVLLIAAASLVADGTSVLYAVIAPLLGAVVGSGLGGLAGRPRRT